MEKTEQIGGVQQENRSFREFSRRTDQLAVKLGISLEEVAREMDIGSSTFFAARTGKLRISPKTWMKMEEGEHRLLLRTFSESASHAAEDPAPYGRPSTRKDCEEYAWSVFNAAEASGDADAFPWIMRTLRETFPLEKFQTATETAEERHARLRAEAASRPAPKMAPSDVTRPAAPERSHPQRRAGGL